jgi:hypothetical protein
MTVRSIRVPLMMGCIPFPIEAEWDPRGAHLAGFPLNIVYSSVRPDGAGVQERLVACYWFDEGTYREDDTVREMAYAPQEETPYSVLVRFHKASGQWETVKYCAGDLVCYASGANYEGAMIQTTLVGVAPDEPATLLDASRQDTLVSVAIGSRIDQLFDHFPELHAHRWKTGEVLYEACNHPTQEVFTFIEKPESRGYVTTVWVQHAEDPSVCRDENGALPQIDTPAVTPEGVKVGDPAATVLERYGQPARVEHNVPGTELLVYEVSSPAGSRATNLLLSFLVAEGHVRGFMLQGDIRGTETSQGPQGE